MKINRMEEANRKLAEAQNALNRMIDNIMHADKEEFRTTPWMCAMTQAKLNKAKELQAAILEYFK